MNGSGSIVYMARKKQAEPSAETAAPPAPANTPATPADPAPHAAEAPAAKDSGSTSDAPTGHGGTARNRTEAKLLKELESIRVNVMHAFSDRDKYKLELKEQKSATRRPRAVRVGKKPAAVEVEATA